jgi:hypothetical protein
MYGHVNVKFVKGINVYKYVRISKRVSFVLRTGPPEIKLNALTMLKYTKMLTQPSDVTTVLTAALII